MSPVVPWPKVKRSLVAILRGIRPDEAEATVETLIDSGFELIDRSAKREAVGMLKVARQLTAKSLFELQRDRMLERILTRGADALGERNDQVTQLRELANAVRNVTGLMQIFQSGILVAVVCYILVRQRNHEALALEGIAKGLVGEAARRRCRRFNVNHINGVSCVQPCGSSAITNLPLALARRCFAEG